MKKILLFSFFALSISFCKAGYRKEFGSLMFDDGTIQTTAFTGQTSSSSSVSSINVSSHTYYFSNNGSVVGDCFTENTSTIQAILNLALNYPIEVVNDLPCVMSDSLTIYSSTTIRGLNGSKWLKKGGNNQLHNSGLIGGGRPLFVNSNSAGGPNTTQDVDIKLIDLYIDGNRRNDSSGGSQQYWNAYSTTTGMSCNDGWIFANDQNQVTPAIALVGVFHAIVENVYVYDPPCVGLLIGNSTDVYVNNMRAEKRIGDNEANSDVLSIGGWTNNISVNHITGKFDDAQIEVIADSAPAIFPNFGCYVSIPGSVGGPISDISIRDLHFSGLYGPNANGVTSTAQNGFSVTNLLIDGVTADSTVTASGIKFYNFASQPSAGGQFNNVIIKNVSDSHMPSQGLINMAAASTYNGLVIEGVNAIAGGLPCDAGIEFSGGAIVEQLTITDVTSKGCTYLVNNADSIVSMGMGPWASTDITADIHNTGPGTITSFKRTYGLNLTPTSLLTTVPIVTGLLYNCPTCSPPSLVLGTGTTAGSFGPVSPIVAGANITVTNSGGVTTVASTGGGGGAGSLNWQLNGAGIVTSSTGNFSNAFTLTNVGGVATVGANSSSITLQGVLNDIHNQTTRQAGAALFVDTGTSGIFTVQQGIDQTGDGAITMQHFTTTENDPAQFIHDAVIQAIIPNPSGDNGGSGTGSAFVITAGTMAFNSSDNNYHQPFIQISPSNTPQSVPGKVAIYNGSVSIPEVTISSAQVKMTEPILVAPSGMGGEIDLNAASGGNYIGIKSSAAVTTTVWVLPNADGTSGQVIQTDGNKNLSFVTPSGGGSVVSVYPATATASFPFGFSASTGVFTSTIAATFITVSSQITSSPTNSFSERFGASAMKSLTSGINNTALGYQALSLNSSANGNTAVGFNALSSNVIGTNNTGIGLDSLQFSTGSNNTSLGALSMNAAGMGGSDNTGIGNSSLHSLTNGTDNIAIGEALNLNTIGSKNVAAGDTAMGIETTGKENTAFGYGSLPDIVNGNFNTALGGEAGSTVNGSSNTFVGYQSHGSVNTLNNATAIGAGAIVTASNMLVLGSSGTAVQTYGTLTVVSASTQPSTINNGLVVGGHIEVSSTTPTLSSCGTSPSIVGNDFSGTITVGSVSATSCVMTFAVPFANAPSCQILSATAIASPTGSTTTTAFTFGGTVITSDVIMYTCTGWR